MQDRELAFRQLRAVAPALQVLAHRTAVEDRQGQADGVGDRGERAARGLF